MKRFIMFSTGIAAVAAMMLSCNLSDNAETPQEGKFSADLVGTYTLDRARLVIETSVDSLRYEGMAMFSYKGIIDSVTLINKEIAAELKGVDCKLNLKNTGMFSVTIAEADEEIGSETYPDDLEADEDFPYMREDFTWFSTSKALYLAIDRKKTDVLIDELLAEDEEEPMYVTPSKVKAQVNKAAAALAAAVEDNNITSKDLEKYLASLIYVSDDVYAVKLKYVLSNDVLTLIPVDKEYIATVLASADLLVQEVFKSLSGEELLNAKGRYSMLKSIAEQVLKDCTKIQTELTFEKDK